MQNYINELDRLAAAESHYLRWNSNPLVLSYVNPENLRRFQRDFDAMEQLVKDDPAALSNVRAERVALDLNTLYIWGEYSRRWSLGEKELDRIAARCLANLEENFRVMRAAMEKRGIRNRPNRGQYETEITRGYRLALAAAKRAKSPLPEGATFEVVPEVELKAPVADPDAAHGYAIEVAARREALLLAYQDGGVGGSVVPNELHTKWSAAKLSPVSPADPKAVKRLESQPSAYRWYRVGKARLTYDCSLYFRQPKYVGYFPFGRAFDPAHPDREYEFFLSMKAVGDGKVRFDRAALRPVTE